MKTVYEKESKIQQKENKPRIQYKDIKLYYEHI